MPRYASLSSTINRTQDSNTAAFSKNLSAADIATLKSDIESKFPGVAFIYTGNEFDYKVTLSGPILRFTNAMNTLFPKGRDDITIIPFRTLP